MNGNRVHYKPGWDCHGLPIEMKAKSVKNEMNPLEIRKNGSYRKHSVPVSISP